MFKRFRVRVAKNFVTSEEDWYDLGTYRARNLRGLQVFNVAPPKGDLQFFRYLRIDVLEHYGSEYYCPITLLRIYGLTQLDDYKKEEEESLKLLKAMEEGDSDDIDDELDAEEQQAAAEAEAAAASPQEKDQHPVEAAQSRLQDAGAPGPNASEVHAANPNSDEQAFMAKALNEMLSRTSSVWPNDSDHVIFDNASFEEEVGKGAVHSLNGTSDAASKPTSTSKVTPAQQERAQTGASVDATRSPQSASSASNSTSSTRSSASASASGRQNSPPAAVQSPTGESIFKSIAKRLSALEANATLSMQYMEHNGQMLLDVFARMEKKQDDRLSDMLRALNASNWRQIEALVSSEVRARVATENMTDDAADGRNDGNTWISNAQSSSSMCIVSKPSLNACG